MPVPFARTIRLLLSAAVLTLVLVLAGISVLQVVQVDIAIGNVVLRSQKGATFPLASTELPAGPPEACTESSAAPVVRNVILLIGDEEFRECYLPDGASLGDCVNSKHPLYLASHDSPPPPADSI